GAVGRSNASDTAFGRAVQCGDRQRPEPGRIARAMIRFSLTVEARRVLRAQAVRPCRDRDGRQELDHAPVHAERSSDMRFSTCLARHSRLALVLALWVIAWWPQPAVAHHVIGVTITPTNVDSVAHSANVNVTESTTGTGSVHVGVGVAWGDAV